MKIHSMLACVALLLGGLGVALVTTGCADTTVGSQPQTEATEGHDADEGIHHHEHGDDDHGEHHADGHDGDAAGHHGTDGDGHDHDEEGHHGTDGDGHDHDESHDLDGHDEREHG